MIVLGRQSAQRQGHRQAVAGGGAPTAPCPGCSQPCPKSHWPVPTHTEKHRAEGQAGGPQCPVGDTSPQPALAGLPQGTLSPTGWGDAQHQGSRSTWQSELPRDVGHMMGCEEKHSGIEQDLLQDVWGGDQRQGNEGSGWFAKEQVLNIERDKAVWRTHFYINRVWSVRVRACLYACL